MRTYRIVMHHSEGRTRDFSGLSKPEVRRFLRGEVQDYVDNGILDSWELFREEDNLVRMFAADYKAAGLTVQFASATYTLAVQLTAGGLPIQLGGLNYGKAKEAIRALLPGIDEGLIRSWSLCRDHEGY